MSNAKIIQYKGNDKDGYNNANEIKNAKQTPDSPKERIGMHASPVTRRTTRGPFFILGPPRWTLTMGKGKAMLHKILSKCTLRILL
jgi:hypothetical protein